MIVCQHVGFNNQDMKEKVRNLNYVIAAN